MPKEFVHIRRFKENILQPGEKVIEATPATLGDLGQGCHGAFMITDRRIVFYYKRFWKERVEQMPLSKISQVKQTSFFTNCALKIFDQGAGVLTIRNLNIKQARRFSEILGDTSRLVAA